MSVGKKTPARGPPTQLPGVPRRAAQGGSSVFANADEEVYALIETMRAVEERLDELTAGQLDVVMDSTGRTFLLQRAQEQLRDVHASRQAGILNALPAHIALLDAHGTIVSVNEAWSRFARDNGLEGDPADGRANYLQVCDALSDADQAQPHPVADGIRSVLSGAAKSFSMEYACHSPTQQRWFLMLVNPLSNDRRLGVVVMHVDVSEEKRIEESLRRSEKRFKQLAASINDVFFLIDAMTGRMLYVSPAYETIWAATVDTLYAHPDSWMDRVHLDDREATLAGFREGMKHGAFLLEYRIVGRDRAIRWIETRAFPVYDADGAYIRVSGISSDVTVRKTSELGLLRLARLHTVLSKVGEAIVRIDDRQVLYDAVCRIVVEDGGLRMVFVADVTNDAMHARPIASFGEGQAFLLDSAGAGNEPMGWGSVGTVVRTGLQDRCNDIDTDPRMRRWREAATSNGLLASASFPLRSSGTLVSVLVLYAGDVNYFQDDEIRLMAAVANTLSFALESLDHEQQRTRAEAQVREGAALLKMAGRVGRLGAWVLELPSLALTWSAEVLAIHELRPDYMATVETAIDFYPEEARPTIRDAMRTCMEEGTPFDVELPFITAKGRRIWVRSIGEAVRGADGAVERIHGAFQDITEQRRNVELLANHSALMQQFVRHTPAAVAMLDLDMRYVQTSDRWLEDYQLGGRDIIGESHYDVFPDLPAFWRDIHVRVLAGAVDTCEEAAFPRADGSTDWLRWEVRPWRTADGEIAGLIMFTQMITARKQAEETLRRSEVRFRSMFTSAAIGIAISTPGGRYLEANAAYCRMIGYDEAELLERDFASLTHPDDLGVNLDLRDQLLAGDLDSFVLEKRYIRKDGAVVWGRHSVSALRAANGDVVTLMVIAEDITARKHAEQEVRFNEQRYRSLVEATSAIVWSTAASGEFEVEQPGWSAFTGQTFQELRGTGWLDAVHPDDQAETSRVWATAVANTSLYQVEHRLRARERGYRNMMVRAVPIFNDDGLIVQWIGVHTDITDQRNVQAALLESEERYRALIDWSPDAICVHRDGKMIYVNPAGVVLAGAGSPHDLIGRSLMDMLEPEPDETQAEVVAGDGGEADVNPRTERKLVALDGRIVDIEMQGIPILYDGEPAFYSSMRDIGARKQAEERIRYLSRVHAVLSGINTLIVRERDREELFNEACRIAVEAGNFRIAMVGMLDATQTKMETVALYAADESLRATIAGIVEASAGALTAMTALAVQGKTAIVANDSQNDPRVASAYIHEQFGVRSMAILPLVVADHVVGALALYSNHVEFFHAAEMTLLNELAGDISFAIEHIARGEKLEYLAYYDATTGLANRTLFLERVAQFARSAASAGNKLAVGLIDLERFKHINDTLGRPAGDALLRQVAQWLATNAGDASLVARIDADHFAFVVPQIRPEGDIAGMLERQRRAFLDHAFQVEGAALRTAGKIGVAVFPEDGADAETLFKHAEAALRKAKSAGEPYLFYQQTMSTAVSGKLAMENQLRQAVDQGEFVLYYQPKIHIASGKPTGAEALIRWNNPRTGLVSPAEFIPLLEETGLIHEVGRWALLKAAEDFARWRVMARTAGVMALRIAVNVSPLQLRHRHFVDEIAQVVALDAHAAAGLELEITESLIMEDVRHTISSLQKIRAMCVSIAIDDFGTGFSSLNYLSKLPIDTLKIDRSFVVDMTSGPEGLALVSTIINLAHSLRLNVVAEGVETDEQSRLLRLLGCDELQGYLISRPLPVEQFEAKFLSLPTGE
ncbi:MAG: PAS domain S-box protein [Dokdonella sp.]|uniref:PAS domain S-box protein n=1 Tax=Dokdonella sp. TaxID=2291710 RepID=UPI0032672320